MVSLPLNRTLIVLILTVAVVNGIYFAHQNPELCLPIPSAQDTVVGRLYAYPHKVDDCNDKGGLSDVISYDVIDHKDVFAVNSSGSITLLKDLASNATGPISFGVAASCTGKNSKHSTKTSVTVNLHKSNNIENVSNGISADSDVPDSEIDDICFSHISDDTSFTIEENSKDVIVGRLNTCFEDKNYERTYRLEKPKNRFSIDPVTSELKVIKELDRESLVDERGRQEGEINGIQPLKITCEVKVKNKTYSSERRRFNISVLDVNDNPPTFHRHNSAQRITKDLEIQTDEQNRIVEDIEEIVEDIDSYDGSGNGSHVAKVFSDLLGVCKPDLHCFNPKNASTVCRFRVHLQNLDAISANLYKCEVAVVDNNFLSADNAATMVVNIHKPLSGVPTAMSLRSTLAINFYRNATRLARLYKLNNSDPRSNIRYYLRDKIFSITPKSGIIYVDNMSLLATVPDTHSITVAMTDAPDVTIVVKFYGSARNQPYCEESCARHETTKSCTGSCGLGVSHGGCVMRGNEFNPKLSQNYGTCTYDVDTCPDQNCDELEEMFQFLCPQDCTSQVIGAYVLNNKVSPPRGIKMAESPCWCEGDHFEIVCSCMSGYHQVLEVTEQALVVTPIPKPQPTKLDLIDPQHTAIEDKGYSFAETPAVVDPTVTNADNGTDPTEIMAQVTEQAPFCDKLCGAAIGVGLTMLLLILFSLFMLWFTKKKNDRRKSNLKHVGSVTSLSGNLSDYQDDRERRLSYSSDHWSVSQKGPVYNTPTPNTQNDNAKWEICRDQLTLEKTLGEGEFGLVVKGRLAISDGENRNVAVKMLKHCSTQLEEQDLWSEYNLLKDVSHPNVIKLIGACTTDGPFYLVVEFCRYGCLLKYLRRSRLEENGYVNSAVRFRSPNLKEQTDPDMEGDLLSMRDLLSFAWQIAKGMSYLSEIKLVHRDLAARNILVASGKVLKISDFGLTRDVYEADQYLKKSKGRIPVKWLAPESLYAQIYTTRSDIWSYGIVLWELVTLGAPPYPGIPPERLYNLLIGGYRMDKPENCPDEMYAVMQKCWKIDATDRPSFASLAIIFDRILQEKTGYLDLSQENRHLQELYKKSFNTDQSYNDIDEASSDKTEGPTHNGKVTIFTVCNETYNTDAYLTPTLTGNPEDEADTFMLNIESNLNKESVENEAVINTEKNINENQNNCDNNEETVNDISDNLVEDKKTVFEAVEQITEIANNTNHIKSPARSSKTQNNKVQGYKKTSEKTLPTVRYTKANKNKHIIYPSEGVSLLAENGKARALKDELETSQL